ncbi:MAG: hypothetical protein F4Z71_09750, partial [Gammaproteobacteria bacterium]|nr:hypothetical protein [Gammaproteobacteria bacterium]
TENGGAVSVTVTAAVTGGATYGGDTEVTVSVGASDDSAAEGADYDTVADFKIDIPAGEASATHTFTLTPKQDALAEGGEIISVEGSAGETVTVNGDTIALTDDEALPVATLNLSPSTINESGTGNVSTVTASLDRASSAETTITVSLPADAPATLSSNKALTIAAGSRISSGVVTVTATDNKVDAADATVNVQGTASGGHGVANPTAAALTIKDNDTRGLVLSEESLGVAEGGQRSYTVALKSQPTAEVTVTVSGHDGADLTLDKTSLTFTASNWDTAQTVTVTAGQDDDAGNDAVTLAHAASGGDYGSVSANLKVAVTDDESPGIVLSPASLTVNEGVIGSYTVALATQPSAQVTVTISGHDGTDLTPNKTSLTFTRSNWSAAQTVTVSAAQDDDAGNDTATLTHDASGGDYADVSSSLEVTVKDDDTAAIILTPASLTVNEGASGSYTVALATEPTAEVTVTISGHDGTDLTPGKTSLTFTRSNWSAAQTVNLGAAQDDDAGNDTATLIHAASGGDYADVSASLAVTVTDDDAAGIVLDPADGLAVDEGGSGSYTVALATEPSGAVTVKVTGQSGTDLTLDSASLTFTASNWSEAQTVNVSAGEDDDAGDDTVTLTHTASGGGYADLSAALKVTVDDDETAALTLTPGAVTVAEPSGAAAYTVALAARPSGTVTVALASSDKDAATVSPAELTFTASNYANAQNVTVTAVDDKVDNTGDKRAAAIGHTASGGGYADVTGSVAVTVTDDDAAPTALNLSVDADTAKAGTQAAVTENGGAKTARVTATLGGATTFDEATEVTVTVGKAGDAAVKGADYTAPDSFKITIPAGSSSAHKDFTLTPTDDALDEDDKTLTLSGSAGAFTIADITITIEDDDALPVLSIADASAVTEGGQASFDITLTPVSGRDVTVAWATADDSGTNAATAGEDYTAANGTATIAAGDAKATVTVNTTDDVRDEPAETFLVELSSPTSATLSSSASNAAGAINDNDKAPTGVTLTASPDSVGEGDDPATVTVTAAVTGGTTYDAATEVTVSVGASDDTATEGTDYDTQDDFTITIGAGNASASKDFTLTPKQDDLREGSESISVDGNAGQTIAVTGDTITLTDDDGQPSFSVANASATEGSAVTFTVTRSGASGNAVSVHWNTKADVDGTNPASASDYTAATTPTKLDFGAGVKTQTFTVATAADSADEPDETFRVVLSSPGGGAAIGAAEAVGAINDDDDPPTLSIDAPSADEGGDRGRDTLRFTVSLSAASGKQVTVDYAEVATTGENVAASGVDYVALSSGTLTFAPGQTSKTIDVTMRGDRIDENNETLTVRLSSPVNASFAGNAASLNGSGTIRDDDDPPSHIELSLSPSSVAESASPNQSIRVTATVKGGSTYARERTVTVTVGDTADSAVSGTDYQPVSSFDVTIAAGAERGSGTFRFTPIADLVQELQGEQVSVNGASGTVNVRPAALTISDKAPVTVAPARAAEGGALEFAVTLPEPAPAGGLTVSYEILAGRGNGGDANYQIATAADFADADGGSIAIAAGARGGVIRIDAVDDAVYESEHYFTVNLTGTGNSDDFPVIVGANSAVGAITDEGDLPVFSFRSPNHAVAEDAGAITLFVDKTGDTLVPATLTWATVEGSAEAGMDFETAGGRLGFAPDDSEKTVSVVVLDDAVSDVGERFSLQLEAVAHAALGQASAAIDIEDNDDALAPELRIVSLDDGAVTEGGAARFALRAERAHEKDLVAELTVAQAGSYLAAGESGARQVTLRAGRLEQAFGVATEDDALDEPDGSVTVTLVSGEGYEVAPSPDDAAAVRVLDDDLGESPGVYVSVSRLEIREGGADGRYTVALKTDPGQEVSIELRSGDETAVTVAPATLVFAAGEWSTPQAVTVTAVDDPDEESERVVISHEVSGYPGQQGLAEVAVEVADDDWTARQVNLEVQPATVIEGGHIAVTANLSGPPGAEVIVPIVLTADSAEPGDFRPETGLDIRIGARAIMGRDTVATVVDGDSDNDTFYISLGDLPEGLEAGGSSSIRVTIVDNQTRGVRSATRWWNALDAEARLRALYGNLSAADRNRLLPWVQFGFDLLEDEMRSRVLFEAIDLLGGNHYRSVADWWQSLNCRLRRVAVGDGKVSDSSSPWCADWPQLDAEQRDEAARVGRALLGDSQLPLGGEPEAVEPALSVADARVNEADGAALEFVVSLSEPASEAVSVSYATRNGSATAGEDYDAAQGALRFEPGDTEHTVSVTVLDDAHDEGEETLTLELSAPQGAVLGRAAATGTIVNSDPLPAAWLARFGRTVAEHALDGVSARLEDRREPGWRGSFGGIPLGGGPRDGEPQGGGEDETGAPDEPESLIRPIAVADDPIGWDPDGLSGPFGVANDPFGRRRDGFGNGALSGNGAASGFGSTSGFGVTSGYGAASGPGMPGGAGSMGGTGPMGGTGTMGGRGTMGGSGAVMGGCGAMGGVGPAAAGADAGAGPDAPPSHSGSSCGGMERDGLSALTGTDFSMTRGEDKQGGTLALWGRGAHTTFGGRDGTLDIGGEVSTGILGADYARGRWLLGLALTQSSGAGTFSDPQAGSGETASTLTAAIPYASLEASDRLSLWGAAGYGAGAVTVSGAGAEVEAGFGWAMAAAGGRGVLFAPAGRGPALDFVADALWSRTDSEKTGEVVAASADVTRLRVGLEGSWPLQLPWGGDIGPRLETGLRHDGGDAETGFGLELGGGLVWNEPRLGLSLDVAARTLLAHEAEGRTERGLSASVAFDPDPSSERGLSLSLKQDFGASASGGLDALFAPEAPVGHAGFGGGAAEGRWSAEAAWGLPMFRELFTGTPLVGYGRSGMGRDYHLGWRLEPSDPDAPELSLGVEFTLREGADGAPERGVGIEVRYAW